MVFAGLMVVLQIFPPSFGNKFKKNSYSIIIYFQLSG